MEEDKDSWNISHIVGKARTKLVFILTFTPFYLLGILMVSKSIEHKKIKLETWIWKNSKNKFSLSMLTFILSYSIISITHFYYRFWHIFSLLYRSWWPITDLGVSNTLWK